MQHEESSFSGVGGTRIVYDVWTPEQKPRGVLVLCHGFGEHARRYDHVVARLGDLGLVVYSPDHRGHGRSGGKRVQLREWNEFSDDLHQLFGIVGQDHPGLDKFLLGHSMGGAMALSYALDHQQDLKALMLSGPAVDVTEGTPKVVVELGKIVGRFLPDVPVQTLDSGAISRDPETVAKYRNDPLVHHGKVPAGIARGLIVNGEQVPERLPSLTIPLLLQHGSDDKLANVNGTKMIAERAGSEDLTVKIYDGFFHEVFNEPERDRVIDDLIEWLRPRIA
ncbi:MAG: alpha/beta hydrolase [Rhodococcus sp.]|nr:alpha/beta hydrolase [Rhodococcus sp. (in: high G+C Gram-positive bacteria)]